MRFIPILSFSLLSTIARQSLPADHGPSLHNPDPVTDFAPQQDVLIIELVLMSENELAYVGEESTWSLKCHAGFVFLAKQDIIRQRRSFTIGSSADSLHVSTLFALLAH